MKSLHNKNNKKKEKTKRDFIPKLRTKNNRYPSIKQKKKINYTNI